MVLWVIAPVYVKYKKCSINSHKDVWSFNPCSFAFIIQKDKFSFSSAYLTSLQNNETRPMVLDWAIGNETCDVARNKGNYICGANSNCSDLKYGSAPGYGCKCKNGYDGNPYLKDGCQGIYSIYLSTTSFFNFLFIYYFFKVYIFHEFLKYCLILVTQKMLLFFFISV